MSVRHLFTRAEILSNALEIRREYERQGLQLTLRQMYYQFVARGLLENGQAVYKRIGDVLTEARYCGDFPVEGLMDRGREVHGGDFTRNQIDVDEAYNESVGTVKALPAIHLYTDKWYGQETFVSVWVEKEALAGIFEQTCNRLDVGWFACRGYPSVSALWSFIEAAREAVDCGCERVKILYFGDHDPDGWEIPRSSERGLRRLMETYGVDLDISLDRIALNMDQIRRYNPPPFPAKETSARFQSYLDEQKTNDAWELDALEPTVLRDLITTNVKLYWNEAAHREKVDEVLEARRELKVRMREPQFAEDCGLNEEDEDGNG